MSEDDVQRVSGVSQDARIHESQKAAQNQRLARMDARQVGSQANMQEAAEMMFFAPMKMKEKFETLDKRNQKAEHGQKSEKGEGKQEDNVHKLAKDYETKNPELREKTLTNLYQEINQKDTHQKILEKLQKFYTDQALADEALDYLIEVNENRDEMKQKLLQAKEEFNAQYGREIQAGRNIGMQAREFSQKGLGSPTALRDLYREVTGNPRTPNQLFEELVEKFKFSDMKNIIDFILHSIGADMKAKGPSISRAELGRLFGEARTMQAILGVFRFFFSRMKMIQRQFDQSDLAMPSRINFEVLARLLMKLIEERYPTPDRVLQQAFVLGIAEEIAAQVIVFSQYRDSLRHLSPKLFKSERHRQEILMALMEALSDLEDELYDDEE